MIDSPPTDLLVGAQIRRAASEGVAIVVRQRGDNNSGTVILKINLMNGTARVLTQVRLDEELVWSPSLSDTPLPEPDVERYLEQQINFDPDCWVIEIEDRQGRPWFPGRLLSNG